jgi:hypothetical protein
VSSDSLLETELRLQAAERDLANAMKVIGLLQGRMDLMAHHLSNAEESIGMARSAYPSADVSNSK